MKKIKDLMLEGKEAVVLSHNDGKKYTYEDRANPKKALEMMSKAVRDVSKVCEDLLNIKQAATNKHADIVFFGHSHFAWCRCTC